MAQSIYIGNFPYGLTTNRLPFNIDNNSFPYLYNFYVWRGRVKRKRGTVLLGQLQLQIVMAAMPLPWQYPSITLTAGAGNLITQLMLESTSTITPKSISLIVGGNTYTDPSANGTLVGAPSGTGTINYATGAFTITGGASSTVTGTFSYYPGLPVMGLEDYIQSTLITTPDSSNPYPLLLAFDTTYAYQLKQTTNNVYFYNVSYYKATNNPVYWSAPDYQQFWSTNYSGAFWATNNKPGFHFKALSPLPGTTVTQLTATTVMINLQANGLILGDLVWMNEVTGSIGSSTTANQNINGQTGRVTTVGTDSFTATFDGTMGTTLANFQSGATGTNGIAQYLTNSIEGQDGIRWYDGDPTNGSGIPVTADTGWVNFAPPLTAATVTIDFLPPGKYYLVGALMIQPFKDRLLFFGPWVQTSGNTSPQLLQDTVIWSWNGTPYYSSLTPANQTSDPTAYYVDQTGKGGYLSAGISSPIVTLNNNEDVLLVGFTSRQTRFIYTGNDINPFLFFNINSELGSSATFSGVTLDQGGLSIGTYGIAQTDQQSAQRIDLDIPTEVFNIQASNHGTQRISAARDYYREWIYFSYPNFRSDWSYPTETFLYNYRDRTWSVLYENFTCHGSYRKSDDYTWGTLPFPTWGDWNEAWGSATTSAQFPSIIAGNPQGYVLIKAEGTGEGASGTVQAIATNVEGTQITSTNHCVAVGDYLYFQSALGLTDFNGLVGKVISVLDPPDPNNFIVDIPFPSGTYLGLGTYARLSQPFLQTKEFNPFWEQGRQARLSVQKYLFDTTQTGQVTVNIYLSQDPDNPWNAGSIDPNDESQNNALIYSQIVYTCPESTNIGLTPANTNLQMPTAQSQKQIWHRMNTSLIGDTIQLGVTLNDAQMKDYTNATAEVTLHAVQLIVSPSSLLS